MCPDLYMLTVYPSSQFSDVGTPICYLQVRKLSLEEGKIMRLVSGSTLICLQPPPYFQELHTQPLVSLPVSRAPECCLRSPLTTMYYNNNNYDELYIPWSTFLSQGWVGLSTDIHSFSAPSSSSKVEDILVLIFMVESKQNRAQRL